MRIGLRVAPMPVVAPALRSSDNSLPPLGCVLVVLLVWAGLFKELSVEWIVNPLYSYGWGVPLLMLYLFWNRFADRPCPSPSTSFMRDRAFIAFLLFLIFPLRLIQEANPDWRLVSWLWALTAVALTLAMVHSVGGRPWLRHFAFPVLFGLLAVPWPTQLETAGTQELMRAVTGVTAESLNWLGIAAVQKGNVIELAGQAVGIEEACSGIRSLQTYLMVALFAGELFRLSVRKRMGLVVLALFLALGLNMIRTGGLALICAWGDAGTETRWHDTAGWLTLVLGCAVLWSWARHSGNKPAAAPIAILGCASSLVQTQTKPRPVRRRTLLPWGVAASLLWLVMCEAGTRVWYRIHEPELNPRHLSWGVRWPEEDSTFKLAPLSERTRALLRSDQHQAAFWQRADGTEWTFFFLGWKPGRMAAQLAAGHTPDVCLAATGLRSLSKLGLRSAVVHGLVMPFNTYEFEGQGRKYHVFFCLMDDRDALTGPAAAHAAENHRAGLLWQNRWQAVRNGKRHGGQKVLEVVIQGYATGQDAFAALELALPGLIEMEQT